MAGMCLYTYTDDTLRTCISNSRSSRWFKIYSRKTLEKQVKKAVFAIFAGRRYYNPKI